MGAREPLPGGSEAGGVPQLPRRQATEAARHRGGCAGGDIEARAHHQSRGSPGSWCSRRWRGKGSSGVSGIGMNTSGGIDLAGRSCHPCRARLRPLRARGIHAKRPAACEQSVRSDVGVCGVVACAQPVLPVATCEQRLGDNRTGPTLRQSAPTEGGTSTDDTETCTRRGAPSGRPPRASLQRYGSLPSRARPNKATKSLRARRRPAPP